MILKEQWLIVTPNIRSLQEISIQKEDLGAFGRVKINK